MFVMLTTVVEFEKFFTKTVRDADRLLNKFDDARANNQLAWFLRSYGVDLQIAVVQSQIAVSFLDVINDQRGNAVEEATIYANLVDVIEDKVRNMSLKLNSSSTSANIDQDASNQFYLDMFRNLK